uniref:DNA topoisomerase n=1 Tax=Sphenodon punctatus TaxID=8508 RepID=A0A8D0L418_SPHPU
MILGTRFFAQSMVRLFSRSWGLFSEAAEGTMLRNIQKVLCVAEKNDAARGIADLLSNSRMRRREGLSKFNKIYEYEYHMFGQVGTCTLHAFHNPL